MDQLKKHAHDSGTTEDEVKHAEKETQKLTDEYIAKIDVHVTNKEKEIIRYRRRRASQPSRSSPVRISGFALPPAFRISVFGFQAAGFSFTPIERASQQPCLVPHLCTALWSGLPQSESPFSPALALAKCFAGEPFQLLWIVS